MVQYINTPFFRESSDLLVPLRVMNFSVWYGSVRKRKGWLRYLLELILDISCFKNNLKICNITSYISAKINKQQSMLVGVVLEVNVSNLLPTTIICRRLSDNKRINQQGKQALKLSTNMYLVCNFGKYTAKLCKHDDFN